MNETTLVLRFDAGTLLLDGAGAEARVPEPFRWDARVMRWRAPAWEYRRVVKELVREKTLYEDHARAYHRFDFPTKFLVEPRPYQQEAIEEWRRANHCGVVVLPTGAGKSLVAQMAIEQVKRSTLVVVPTLDLMNQWYDLLLSCFKAEVGLIGGGYFEVGALTVTTYASAFRFMERLGNRFGLVIFDECHHLPSGVHRIAAEMCIAPFRLGLSATPERADGEDVLLERLVGPFVFRRETHELAGEYLSDYTVVRLRVELSVEERAAYERERDVFRAFLREKGIGLELFARLADVRRGLGAFAGGAARDAGLPRVEAHRAGDGLEAARAGRAVAAPPARARCWSSRPRTRWSTASRAASSSRPSRTRRASRSGARGSKPSTRARCSRSSPRRS